MAIVEGNLLSHGVRGKSGNHVYRILNGKQIISRAPVSKNGWKPTENQARNRAFFKKNHLYALKAKNDPELCKFYEAYQKPGKFVYHIALRDSSKPPTIDKCSILTITPDFLSLEILAEDDTKVVSVEVILYDEYNQQILSGHATEDELTIYWTFTSNDPNLKFLHSFKIIARDMAGNETFLNVLV